MSAQVRTLGDLIDAVARRADIKIATGTRHDENQIEIDINRSIRRWKQLVAEAGDDADLITVRVQTDPDGTRGADNWAPNQYLLQPTSPPFWRVRGMDVWPSTRPVAMMPVDEAERDDAFYGWLNSGGTGLPVFYRIGGHVTVDNGGDPPVFSPAPIIQIFPWADAVYTVDIRYIPVWADATDLGAQIEFLIGGDEWVVNDAAIQALVTDGQAPGGTVQYLTAWNRQIAMDLQFSFARRSPSRKLDTRAQRRALMALANPAWRGLL